MTDTKISTRKVDLLALDNPMLSKAANKIGRKPENLRVELQGLFNTNLEQSLALQVISEFGHLPKSIREVFDIVNNNEPLRDYDRERSPVTGISKLSQMEALVEGALVLILRIPNDFDGIGVTIRQATLLSITYGEGAEDFIEGLLENIEDLRAIYNMKYDSRNEVARTALWQWESKMIPYCEKHGMPYPKSLIDFYTETGEEFDPNIEMDQNSEGDYGDREFQLNDLGSYDYKKSERRRE